jgi:hypothetical protein
VRIHEPRPAFARARRDGAFLAAELGRHERLQRDLQPLLDLAVSGTASTPAARPLRAVELRAQQAAFGFHRGDDVLQEFSGCHIGSVQSFLYGKGCHDFH